MKPVGYGSRMFNLGLPELLIVGAVALLVFGPKKLPELAKSLGKGMRDFKKALEGNDDEKPPAPESKPPTPEVLPGEGPTQARVDTPVGEKTPVSSDPHHKS